MQKIQTFEVFSFLPVLPASCNQAESHTFKAKKRIDTKRTKDKNKKLTAIALSTKFGTEKRNSPRTFNCSDQTHHKYSGNPSSYTERPRKREKQRARRRERRRVLKRS